MSSTFIGRRLRLSIFGQSHSEAIGMTLDGLPAGLPPPARRPTARNFSQGSKTASPAARRSPP